MIQREKKNRVRTRQTKMKTQQTNGKLQISMYACIAAAATAIAVAADGTTTVLCAYASLKKILIFIFALSFSFSLCVCVCIHDRALEIFGWRESNAKALFPCSCICSIHGIGLARSASHDLLLYTNFDYFTHTNAPSSLLYIWQIVQDRETYHWTKKALTRQYIQIKFTQQLFSHCI